MIADASELLSRLRESEKMYAFVRAELESTQRALLDARCKLAVLEERVGRLARAEVAWKDAHDQRALEKQELWKQLDQLRADRQSSRTLAEEVMGIKPRLDALAEEGK